VARHSLARAAEPADLSFGGSLALPRRLAVGHAVPFAVDEQAHATVIDPVARHKTYHVPLDDFDRSGKRWFG
jgi:hypothetical protein